MNSNNKETNKKTKTSAIKKSKSKLNNLEQFNLLGAFIWLNLTTMEKNRRYSLTNLKRHTTKYGVRLMAELDNRKKLYLPERYNSFSDRQLVEMGGGKYDLINRGPEGKTFKIELVPKMICNEKSEMLAKSTSNEKLQATTSSPASPDSLTTEASPPSKQLENNSSTVLSLSSLLDLSQNITTQKPEEDDDDEEYGMNISDDDDDDNDDNDDDEENFDPQNIAQNFYSQKPYLGL
jgi:hypothetical protein